MTKIHFIAVILVSAGLFISCSPGKEKTIANLKEAINGELTASVKYNTFADLAAKDSIYNVEAMFRAVSKAEAIHAGNHLKVLKSLGINDFKPDTMSFEVGSTLENLRGAIEGETYEFTAMYPQIISEAKAEGADDAVTSFNYAQDAEIGHSKIFAETLSRLSNNSVVSAAYFVCPKCGFIYVDDPGTVCCVCKMPSEKFLAFHAAMPLVEMQSDAIPVN